jgi:hypothetical protein
MSSFDVVIIGSGPGGYVAIRCYNGFQNSNYRKYIQLLVELA